jgi:ABC transport system ATP-binding/permease protein
LEGEIAELEKEKEELEEILQSGTSDYAVLSNTTARLGEVIHQIGQKSDRWLELSEFA